MHSYFVHIYLHKLFLKKFIEPWLNQSDRLNLDLNTPSVQSTVRVSKHYYVGMFTSTIIHMINF